MAFLAGDWSAGRGAVAETGGTSTGTTRFEPAADGEALIRRDHTALFDKAGKPAGSFDQTMLIYAEGGALRGDYVGHGHVIHYVSATVEPGRAVTFRSATQAGAPTFELSYRLTAPATLAIGFGVIPPGGSAVQPIADGTVTRTGAP